MPLPDAAKAADEFIRRLRVLEDAASQQLVDAYTPIWQRLRANINGLLEEVQHRALTVAQAQRLSRYNSLLEQVASEVGIYSRNTAVVIGESQVGAVGLAQASARQVTALALPRGLTMNILARAGIAWDQLPAEAFERFIGIAGDGSPLARLLSPLGAEAREGVIQAIGEGIALGKSPRDTAALVRVRFGMPLSRSLGIVRTETLRAFREANRLQYVANQNIVKGYRRHSARDGRVCMACIALDGEFYPLEKPLNEHSGGRCALLPDTITYRDLGLDVDEAPSDFESASDWFLKQPEKVQRTMMGPGKFTAWRAGEFQLKDMAKLVQNETWGEAAVVAPLKELVG